MPLAVRLWRQSFLARPGDAAVLINAITGQAGFLTAALFLGGIALLPKGPFLAGLLLG